MADNDLDSATDAVDGDQQAALDRHAERNRMEDERSEIIQAVPPVLMRGALYAFMGAIALALIVSYFTEIHVKVPARGEIVPQGENITVEAREAGVVLTVDTSEGEFVHKGDVLITLQRSQSESELKSLVSSLELQRQKQSQLEKSRDISREIFENPALATERPAASFIDAGAALVYINALRAAQKQLAAAKFNMDQFNKSGRALAVSQITVNRATRDGYERALVIARKTLQTRQQVLERRRKELVQAEKLAAQRIVPISQVNSARDNVITAESRVNEQRQTINQTLLNISKTRLSTANQRSALAQKEREFRDEIEKAEVAVNQALADIGSAISTLANNINATDAGIASLEGKLALQEDQIKQLKITSPVDGTITAMGFQTPGRVVSVGNPIATIVPDDARPIVIAQIANKDVAFVKEGIPARVKVEAYPFRQFGTIPARVLRIYPLPNKPEFAVRLELEQSTLKVRGKLVALRPGLRVEVDLLTEKRRIIEMLLKKMN